MLPIRVNVIAPANLFDEISNMASKKNPATELLRFGGFVIFADGYLASRTAALFEPYSDYPVEKGRLLCSIEEMAEKAGKISKAGFQLVIHAVGDKAVDSALSVIEGLSGAGAGNVLRCRIEQAAVLNEQIVERMKEQRIVVSVQPLVIASEFSVWSAVDRVGSRRARWLFPIKTLAEKDVSVVAGSDCPMEPLNPMLGIQEAVTREPFPEEQVSVMNALRLYTVNAAYASFEEGVKGSIEVGKLADFAVLSDDPRLVSINNLRQISVEMTIIGGRVIYSK